MTHPVPPQIEAARQRLQQVLRSVEKRDVDLSTEGWPEIEKAVVKVLMGPFKVNEPEHQFVALGLAGALAERLAKEHGAFWFPNRESLEGAALGFPDALIMLSPFGAVVEALSSAKLDRLSDVAKEIRTALAQVRFSVSAIGSRRLSPVDYARLFDPGFVQFVSVDANRAKQVYEGTPIQLSRDLKDALGRAKNLPPEAKQQFEGQILRALERLEPMRPMHQQVEREVRLIELLAHLYGSTGSTGAAPEELWADLVLPLLYIGTPEKFPPLEPADLEAFKQGVEPLAFFVDVVPYATPAPEEGLLGAVSVEEIELPHPSFERVGSLRFVRLKSDRLRPLLERFEEAKVREAVRRFTAYAAGLAKIEPPQSAEAAQLIEIALRLLSDLKRLATSGGELHLRRITEAEAMAEGALSALRQALQGPRLILV